MTHHHNHEHEHHHERETTSPLSFSGRMIKRLENWIKHNNDHAKTYREWAENAKENDMDNVGVLLDDVVKRTKLITEKFEEALKIVKQT